jgi:hypothetical protein
MRAEMLSESKEIAFSSYATIIVSRSHLVALLVILLLCRGGFTHEHSNKTADTALVVSFTGGDDALLMIEAALLLAQNDFHVSLLLVGSAAQVTGIPSSSETLKVRYDNYI